MSAARGVSSTPSGTRKTKKDKKSTSRSQRSSNSRTQSRQKQEASNSVGNTGERILIAQGLSYRDVEIQKCALMLACENNNTNQLDKALKTGLDPNVEDDDGWTPLHWAVRHKNRDHVNKLLDRKADPNAQDKNGQTALHWAVDTFPYGSNNIARLLLSAGSDPNVRDKAHFTPYEIAVINENEELAHEMLLSNADPNTFKQAIVPQTTSIRALRVMNRAKAKLTISFEDGSGRRRDMELGPGNAERIPINCQLIMRGKVAVKKGDLDEKKGSAAALSSPDSNMMTGFTTALRSPPGEAKKVGGGDGAGEGDGDGAEAEAGEGALRVKGVGIPIEESKRIKFTSVKRDKRVLLCNLKSSVVSGMQCMLYVTPKDHPRGIFKRRLNFIHAGSTTSRRLQMSSAAELKGKGAKKKSNDYRMICIGSWGSDENPQDEAYRLFKKYALHQQGKGGGRKDRKEKLRSNTIFKGNKQDPIRSVMNKNGNRKT